jgi:PAS domain S-box-containing protein
MMKDAMGAVDSAPGSVGAESRVVAVEELSREVLDALLEGCQIIGFDYRYLYVNDVLAAQSRKSREELLGRTMMECYPGIDQTAMFSVLRRCMEERRHEQLDNEFTFPDGTRIFFELRFVPVRQGVCVLSLDVTERRNRLAAIVNDSDDAIMSRSRDGVITSWNESAERIYGYSAEEMIGKTMEGLIPPERREEEAQIAERVLRGERITHFEVQRCRRDGSQIVMSVTLSPIRDSAGAIVGVATIGRDVTALKQLRAELVRARDAAEAANRDLESFSYSVAHDLRAPLRAIEGFSQALDEDYSQQLDDVGKKYLGYLRDSSKRMSVLIDDMLSLCRVTGRPLRREALDVSALAREAVERLTRAEPGRQVSITIQDGLAAFADRAQLSMVLDHLLGNAWKFTANTRAARIELCQQQLERGDAFCVRDNGAGFDMAQVERLFGVFQRLHSASDFPGTGIGLATVQRVIRQHGGRVWAEGKVGEGASFYFALE